MSACASKQDMLEIANLQYLVQIMQNIELNSFLRAHATTPWLGLIYYTC